MTTGERYVIHYRPRPNSPPTHRWYRANDVLPWKPAFGPFADIDDARRQVAWMNRNSFTTDYAIFCDGSDVQVL